MRYLTRRVSSSIKPINQDEWNLLLSKLNPLSVIPSGYKEFMCNYNGGGFKECILKDALIGNLVVNYFYPLDSNSKNSLYTLIEYSDDDIENGLLPIADDPGGNYYLLNINKEGNGEVYYWSHDSIFENGSDKILLFDSFSDFINSLEVEDD